MPQLTMEQACHLARRSGFCAETAQVEALLDQSDKPEAVDWLLNQQGSLIELPGWHYLSPRDLRKGLNDGMNDNARRMEMQDQLKKMGGELKAWWLSQMMNNTSPLQERMTLFWANHFTSSLKKVKWAPAMLTQNLMLREHALGSFDTLLRSLLRDPAMLLYLDNANSRKQAPNENLARELMELFTLGEGNYSESDVREMARALTGASVSRQTGEYKFRRWFHDAGEKTLLGETADFAPDDIADVLLRQPSLPYFIAQKVWQFMVGTPLNTDTHESLALSFRQSGFDISSLLRDILLHDAFWQSAGTQIKSPVNLLVGSFKLFDISLPGKKRGIQALMAMQQNLFDPPNVKGWPGGNAWYTGVNLPVRERIAEYIGKRVRSNKAAHLSAAQLLAVPAVGRLPAITDTHYIRAVVNDPAYQVE